MSGSRGASPGPAKRRSPTARGTAAGAGGVRDAASTLAADGKTTATTPPDSEPCGGSSVVASVSPPVDVPKVCQVEAWDCGIACASMAIRAVQRDERFGLKGAGAGETDHSSDLLSLTKELGLASVWTIDLAHLLHRHKLAVTMHTVTIGTNEDFSDMSFYEKELVEDGERVNRLFKCAADEGIAVVKHTLPLSDLREALLSRRALFIVLVDLRKLKCSRCWFRWNSLMSWAMDSFAGHYIVVSDYHTDRDEFIFHDPGINADYCRITSAQLDDARHAFGTDEDILEISLG